jgi:hypothetical protein
VSVSQFRLGLATCRPIARLTAERLGSGLALHLLALKAEFAIDAIQSAQFLS